MKKMLAVITLLLSLDACGFKAQNHECVDQMVSFVRNQQESCRSYTEEEWEQADCRYKELLKEVGKHEKGLSVEEKNRIVKATTTYQFLQRLHQGKESAGDREVLGNNE